MAVRAGLRRLHCPHQRRLQCFFLVFQAGRSVQPESKDRLNTGLQPWLPAPRNRKSASSHPSITLRSTPLAPFPMYPRLPTRAQYAITRTQHASRPQILRNRYSLTHRKPIQGTLCGVHDANRTFQRSYRQPMASCAVRVARAGFGMKTRRCSRTRCRPRRSANPPNRRG